MMDNIGITNRKYKTIAHFSAQICLVILQAYLAINLIGIDIFNFSSIEDDFYRVVAQLVVQLGLFSILYVAVYWVFRIIYSAVWKHKNKNIWIRGKWLHIHVKNEIRVGTVVIRQNFNTISAKGLNIAPDSTNLRKTNWYYIMGKVSNENDNTDMIACYRAGNRDDKKKEKSIKEGIHLLDLPNTIGYPKSMEGNFWDTVKSLEQVINVDDRKGGLYLFKITNKKTIKELFSEDFSQKQLEFIYNNQNDPELKPFVDKLNAEQKELA